MTTVPTTIVFNCGFIFDCNFSSVAGWDSTECVGAAAAAVRLSCRGQFLSSTVSARLRFPPDGLNDISVAFETRSLSNNMWLQLQIVDSDSVQFMDDVRLVFPRFSLNCFLLQFFYCTIKVVVVYQISQIRRWQWQD